MHSVHNSKLFITHNHWLDVCRASAILLVLLSHGRRFLYPVFPDAHFFKFGGFLGVEIFFVLSGFLIGSILVVKSNGNSDVLAWAPQFWLRRFLRTYPNYVLFLSINLLVLDSWRPELEPQLLNFLSFTQSLLVPHPGFFGEAWSLAVEEIFYFLIPIMMLMLYRKNAIRSLFFSLIIIFVFSFSMRTVFVISDDSFTFNQIRSTALLRLDSIMFGVLASYIYLSGGVLKRIMVMVSPWMVILFFPVVFISMQNDRVMDESLFLKIFLFPMANIAAVGLIVVGFNIKLSGFTCKVVQSVARWSYSAYLVNLLVVSAIYYYLPPVSTSTAVYYWFLYILCTFLFSFVVYSVFERNILLLRDRWVK
ncbi:acyltransferase family protein [Aeromonas schubertii]|uniref:acyltransferase family protein n=1 Tax=Aeromonas schubertii TaxID=652 RepID=UPI0009E6D0B1|nr:acyltransferase [Aeromonas schubertii]